MKRQIHEGATVAQLLVDAGLTQAARAVEAALPRCPRCGQSVPWPPGFVVPDTRWHPTFCLCGWTGVARFYVPQRGDDDVSAHHRRHNPMGQKVKAAGQTIKKGALHRQLGVPVDQPIPASKKRAALAGDDGPLAKKRAEDAFEGALATGRQTAARNRRRSR